MDLTINNAWVSEGALIVYRGRGSRPAVDTHSPTSLTDRDLEDIQRNATQHGNSSVALWASDVLEARAKGLA